MKPSPGPAVRGLSGVRPGRLRRELGWALALKLIALTALWLSFFQKDPRLPPPHREDIFRSLPSQPSPKEIPDHVR